jgi:hypothetical protein
MAGTHTGGDQGEIRLTEYQSPGKSTALQLASVLFRAIFLAATSPNGGTRYESTASGLVFNLLIASEMSANMGNLFGRQSMLARTLAMSLLLAAATGLRASGPYSPPRILTPLRDAQERDELYESGKAIYWGQVKVGQGSTCADCHASKEVLNRGRLLKVKPDLEKKINNCVHLPERTNGTVESKQMEALVHYLAKRFRL